MKIKFYNVVTKKAEMVDESKTKKEVSKKGGRTTHFLTAKSSSGNKMYRIVSAKK